MVHRRILQVGLDAPTCALHQANAVNTNPNKPAKFVTVDAAVSVDIRHGQRERQDARVPPDVPGAAPRTCAAATVRALRPARHAP